VEDITEALWGTRVSPSTVSNLNKKIYAKIEAWRNQRIEGEHPYLYLDGIVMKRSWAGEVRNVSLLVASAVNSEGFREILGICEGAKEDKSGWSAFLRHLVDRGLKGVQLIISDACRGLIESVVDYLPEARWQRCMVHFYRNVFSHVPATKVRDVSHGAVAGVVGIEGGVVSGVINLESSGVEALDWRPRHDQQYHKDGGLFGRRSAFRLLV
jgi:transposase-like protein